MTVNVVGSLEPKMVPEDTTTSWQPGHHCVPTDTSPDLRQLQYQQSIDRKSRASSEGARRTSSLCGRELAEAGCESMQEWESKLFSKQVSQKHKCYQLSLEPWELGNQKWFQVWRSNQVFRLLILRDELANHVENENYWKADQKTQLWVSANISHGFWPWKEWILSEILLWYSFLKTELYKMACLQ